jgi:HAD superfamily hydrolase (TIGR01509 family)
MPGVEAALAAAREIGVRLAVASSSQRYWVEGHLQRLGLLEHFEILKTADDVEKVKPDPALYLQTLEALGVAASETVAFEDSVNGVKAAKAAGIFCVAVPNAVTRNLDFQHADLQISSLLECDITNILKSPRAS